MDIAALFARWNALSSRVRAGVAAALSIGLCVSIFAGIVSHPNRVALFAAPLHPEQLTEVEERLASWNAPFTPAADNVLVDAGHRSALLLRLSLAGVPHAHVDASSDVLGKLGALTPQAVIDAQTRDGLAGDIELGLRGIDGIEDARVIIAPAQQADFANEGGRDASASVRLRLAPGAQLSHDAIAGIGSFVAASVPGLRANNVTIVDDRGVALGQSDDGGDAGSLQNSLQSALDGAIGAGAAIVRVHVDYDERSVASKDVRRAPLSTLPIASSTQNESYGGGGKHYDRTQQQLDRGSITREINTSVSPGRVARISAAVFVDAARGIDLAQVRSLSSATLGIDTRRGDVLAVQAVNFAHERAAKKDGWWLAYGAIVPLLPTLAVAIAAIVALRFAGAPLTEIAAGIGSRIALQQTAQAVQGMPAANVRGALRDEPPHAAAAIISALPAATAAAVLDMYPAHERAAIIKRMQRPVPPLLADAERLIENA
jgi:flagellar M-ring protein FliF